MLTKKQAVETFKSTLNETDGRKFNIHERRQAWVLYADSLHRSGIITDSQVKRWTNPFPIK
jgi:hypothetical protein